MHSVHRVPPGTGLASAGIMGQGSLGTPASDCSWAGGQPEQTLQEDAVCPRGSACSEAYMLGQLQLLN